MKIVKASPTTLASPFSSTATSFTLTALVDTQGNAITLAKFGTWFALVIKSGATTEIVKCSGLTQNADGTVLITVASSGRAILPVSPYTGGATGEDFPAGADVIVTNDPLTMSTFANVEELTEFQKTVTFDVVPNSSADPVADNDLTRKSYVAALVLGTLTTIDVIVPATAGATIAAGNSCYFDDASNEWKLTDATNAATVNNVLLGIAQGAGTVGNPIAGGILLQGVDTHQTGLTDGQTMYASNTPGAIANSAGTIPVVVGISKGTTQLYFDPRFNQQITQDQMNALAGDVGTPSSSNKFATAQSIAATLALAAPTGKVDMYAGLTAPSGWLLCDGSAVSRATYAALFAILNPSLGTITVTIASPGVVSLTAHGLATGDAIYLTTTGALPTGLSANTKYWVIKIDANSFWLATSLANALAATKITTTGSQSGVHTAGLTPYGVGDGSTTFNVPNLKGSAPVGKDASQAEFAGLGQTGGEKTHTLIAAEMPSHTHSYANSLAGAGGSTGAAASNPGTNGTTGSAGSDGAHNNLQPYLAVNFIIKT